MKLTPEVLNERYGRYVPWEITDSHLGGARPYGLDSCFICNKCFGVYEQIRYLDCGIAVQWTVCRDYRACKRRREQRGAGK